MKGDSVVVVEERERHPSYVWILEPCTWGFRVRVRLTFETKTA
jgi:hypothetical protein